MTSPNKILVALLDGQSTEGALADRLRLPYLVIRAMLQRHEKDGLTTSSTIADCVTIWTLTETGHATARSITPVQTKP